MYTFVFDGRTHNVDFAQTYTSVAQQSFVDFPKMDNLVCFCTGGGMSCVERGKEDEGGLAKHTLITLTHACMHARPLLPLPKHQGRVVARLPQGEWESIALQSFLSCRYALSSTAPPAQRSSEQREPYSHACTLARSHMHAHTLSRSLATHTHTHTYTQTLTPKHTHTLSLSTHTRAHTCVHACTVPLPNYWSRRVYDRFRYLSQAQRKALHSMAAVQR